MAEAWPAHPRVQLAADHRSLRSKIARQSGERDPGLRPEL